MVVVMQPDASAEQIDDVIAKVKELGFTPHPIRGVEKSVVAVIGEGVYDAAQIFEAMPGVDRAVPIGQPYKLAGSDVKGEKTVVNIGDVPVGGEEVVVIAGPCAVENRDQLFQTADMVRQAGVRIIRGSAFKPRTSPHDFQGLGQVGLDLLKEVKQELGLYVVTEVMAVSDLEAVEEVADCLQVGARNMQNFGLLSALGKSQRPVLLKRGMSALVDDLLKAAEYIMLGGNQNVILCERGIRTFELATRFTLDISAIPVIQQLSHLAVLVDPSHAAGDDRYVPALCKAAIAAGADGIFVETHCNPETALCDGPQALPPDVFRRLMRDLPAFAEAAGRKLSLATASA
ncbi:MAG: 3-deoxy-7-phosphoheptulonate synthase [Armatimonadota bacterium]